MSQFKTSELRDTSQEVQELREQLAASQAREQQLREALSNYAEEYDWQWERGMPILQPLSDEALALPSDTTALEALIAKAGEVMREKCVYAADNPLWETEDSIRSLPSITLKDLK